jgi:hypothetical protein
MHCHVIDYGKHILRVYKAHRIIPLYTTTSSTNYMLEAYHFTITITIAALHTWLQSQQSGPHLPLL